MDPAQSIQTAIARSNFLDNVQKSAAIRALRSFNGYFSADDNRRFNEALVNILTLRWRTTQEHLVFLTVSFFDDKIQIVPLSDARVQWFFFKLHRWHRLHNGTKFRLLFIGLCCLLDQLMQNDPSHSHLMQLDIGTINAVVRDVANVLSVDREGIAGLLDSKQHLIGFENGVYDLNLKTFRHGLPADYLARSTGYAYTGRHHGADAVRSFIKSLFVYDELYEYAVKMIARALHGKPTGKLFVLFGPESNGKTSLGRLLLHTGGFCGYAKYHGGSDVDRSNEESMRIRDEDECRYVQTTRLQIFDEKEPNWQLHIDALQTDEMLLRNPHNRQTYRVYDQRTSFVLCSKVTGLLESKSLSKHCIFVPMFANFTNASSGGNFEFRADPTMIDTVKGWGPAAMSLFLQVWEESSMHELDNLVYSPPARFAGVCRQTQ